MADDETATFKVLRTCDAKQQEITISLSKTLQQLKDVLGEGQHFGPLAGTTQRIFHMGRELKSSGRSLAKLGLGRHDNHVLHLHVTPVPADKSGSNSTTNSRISATAAAATTSRRRVRTAVTTVASAPTSARGQQARTSRTTTATAFQATSTSANSRKDDSIIDLLSDSDDDEAVTIVGAGRKRRRAG